MELPKNVTQIGETDKSYKIYMEDYVVSYMKQMNRYAQDKEIAIALYGKCSAEQAVTYCFVYGAGKLDFLQRAVKHLSQAQEQEIEKLHRKYFAEYEFVGYILLDAEMIEGVYLWDKSGCHLVKGYSCFYEKNDSMLAYMLDTREVENKSEELSQNKYNEVRMRQEERRKQYTEGTRFPDKERNTGQSGDVEKRLKAMRFAAAGMFVLLCMVSVVTLQTEGIAQEAGGKIKHLVSGILSNSNMASDTVEAMTGKEIHTLVAEEQLAAAIKQENESVQTDVDAVNPASAVMTPAPTPIAIMTPVPAPAVTPVPTVTPSAEVTPSPLPVQSEPAVNMYTVRTGDTLIGICRRVYGDETYVDAICELNNISNPDNIQMGQKILLP